MPFDYPLTLYRGDSFRATFTFWMDPAKTVAADLTDVATKAEIRNAPGGAEIMALVCEVTLPNAVSVNLAPTQSRLLPYSGAWDLQFTYPNGDVLTAVAGAVSVRMDVTDSTLGIGKAPARA